MVVLSTKPSLDDNEMEDDQFDSEEDSEPELSSDSEGEETVKLSEPSKTAIYNKEGLLDKLGDISWPENVDWLQKLSIDIDGNQEVDVNDDLARELAFYTQALEGTRQAFGKLQSMGLPFLRPFDYYAEMVKSDAHMEKVKGKLLYEKKQIEEAEERRKARESKKIAKQVQAEKLKERAKQKKDQVEAVKKWRKERQKSGFAEIDKDDMPNFEDGKGFERPGRKKLGNVSPWDRSGGKGNKFVGKDKKGGGDKKRKGRDFKNAKFGSGGRKGMKKQNTSDTTSDLRGFNQAATDGKKKRKMK